MNGYVYLNKDQANKDPMEREAIVAALRELGEHLEVLRRRCVLQDIFKKGMGNTSQDRLSALIMPQLTELQSQFDG